MVVFVKFCFGMWLTRKSKRTALNLGSWEKCWKAEMVGDGVGGRGVSSLVEWGRDPSSGYYKSLEIGGMLGTQRTSYHDENVIMCVPRGVMTL